MTRCPAVWEAKREELRREVVVVKTRHAERRTERESGLALEFLSCTHSLTLLSLKHTSDLSDESPESTPGESLRFWSIR